MTKVNAIADPPKTQYLTLSNLLNVLWRLKKLRPLYKFIINIIKNLNVYLKKR